MEKEEYLKLINQDPLMDLDGNGKPRYIKERAVGGGKKSKYIVHQRRDDLLNSIFDWHQFVIKNEQILTKNRNFRGRDGKNEVRNVTEYIVSVELYLTHPVTKANVVYPGIGSASDNGVLTMQSVAPAALEYARSNATKKIGRVFGAYLNKDEDEIYPDISIEDKVAGLRTILKGKFESLNELENSVQLDNNDILRDSPELMILFNSAKEKIKEKMHFRKQHSDFMPILQEKLLQISDVSTLEIYWKSLSKSQQKWAAKAVTEAKKVLNEKKDT